MAVSPKAAPARWGWADWLGASALFAFALTTNIATVYNNAYHFGATLFDSTVFQTIAWHSGWALQPAPPAGDISFLNNHLSLIEYVPNALSYFVPFDRITWFGLVYGLVYGALVVGAFALFRRLMGGRAWAVAAAAAAALVFYLSGPINAIQWEPHQEIASAMLTVAFFLAWGTGRLRAAIVFLVLNACVREDCGVLLALPLALFGLCEWWPQRGKPLSRELRDTLLLAALSFALAMASLLVKEIFFNQIDMFSYYYGPQPFSHLSSGLLLDRLEHLLLHGQYLWLPGIVLLGAALWLRDARFFIGWIAFFPYWLFNFFSREDLNANLLSYKCFPYILVLVWPAILALRAPVAQRRQLIIVQVLVLLFASLAWEDGGPRPFAPSGVEALAGRWVLSPETQNAQDYRAFETRLASNQLGRVRASQGALALYPYSFPFWTESWWPALRKAKHSISTACCISTATATRTSLPNGWPAASFLTATG